MEQLDKYLSIISKITAIYIGVSYATGYLIWNIYLQSLGFYPDLFEARFILTGTIFIFACLILICIYFLLTWLFEWALSFFTDRRPSVFKEGCEVSKFLRIYIPTIIGLASLVIFSFFVFPHIEGYFGGNKPKLISIIGNEQDILYLKRLNVEKSSDIQTSLVCSVYENDKYIVIVLLDRILSLKKDDYKGIVSLPNKNESEYINECNSTVLTNILRWRALVPEVAK